jgi:hypothetical protein
MILTLKSSMPGLGSEGQLCQVELSLTIQHP